MRNGGHEQRFYPNAPRLQTRSCLRRGRICIYLMLCRKSARTALNFSGASRFERWPVRGMVTWRAPGIFAAIAPMTSGEEIPSSSPPTTRVGTPISPRSGVESGRSRMAPRAATAPSGELSKIMARTLSTRISSFCKVSGARRRSICSSTRTPTPSWATRKAISSRVSRISSESGSGRVLARMRAVILSGKSLMLSKAAYSFRVVVDVGLGRGTGGTPESRVIRGDDAVAPGERLHLGLEHPAVEGEGVEQHEGFTLPKVPVRHRYAGSPVVHYALLQVRLQVTGFAVTSPCETIAATDGSFFDGWFPPPFFP